MTDSVCPSTAAVAEAAVTSQCVFTAQKTEAGPTRRAVPNRTPINPILGTTKKKKRKGRKRRRMGKREGGQAKDLNWHCPAGGVQTEHKHKKTLPLSLTQKL